MADLETVSVTDLQPGDVLRIRGRRHVLSELRTVWVSGHGMVHCKVAGERIPVARIHAKATVWREKHVAP